MKVEQQKPEFSPVTITLQTGAEVALLAGALGKVVSGGLESNFLFNLFDRLDELQPYEPNLFEGLLRFTEHAEKKYGGKNAD